MSLIKHDNFAINVIPILILRFYCLKIDYFFKLSNSFCELNLRFTVESDRVVERLKKTF